MATRSKDSPSLDVADASPPAANVLDAESSSLILRSPWQRRLLTFTLPGSWMALLFACLSFTPSLLPRASLFQGVVTGVSAAIGYGVGVFGARIWREFADRDPRSPRSGAWRNFAVVAALCLAVSVVLGYWWQEQLRDVMDMASQGPASLVFLPITAAVTLLLLLAVGRGLRGVYRRLARWLERWFGARAARAAGLIVVVAGTWPAGQWCVPRRPHLAPRTGPLLCGTTSRRRESSSQPRDVRSGSPASVRVMGDAGARGRMFVAGGPSVRTSPTFTDDEAMEPIRIFAGTQSAMDTEERAELAVRDLDRAGGFDRSYLLVATTTGSGWVVPSAVDSFEYITAGDWPSLPSSTRTCRPGCPYLVDQERARDAGRELFDAVYERWSELPSGIVRGSCVRREPRVLRRRDGIQR